MPRVRRPSRGAQLLALAVLGAGAAWLARNALGLELSVDSVRELAERMGIWAPLGFALLVGLRTPLMLPSQLVLTAAGICFGTALGTLVGAVGLSLSAGIAFGVTRWAGSDALRGRIPAGVSRVLQIGGTRGGAGLLALGTAWPFGPTTVYQAAAALTPMSPLVFAVSVAAGAAVRAFTFAYFGNGIAESSWTAVAFVALLLLLACAPLAHPRLRRWLRSQFAPATDPFKGEAADDR